MTSVLLRGSIAVVIVLLPFGAVQAPGVGVSVVLVAMALPAAGAAVAILAGDLSPGRSVLLAGLLLCVFSTLASTFVSTDLGYSMTLTLVAVVSLGYATAIVLAESDGPDTGGWLPFLAVIGGVVAAWALSSSGSVVASDGGGVVTGRLQGPFAQPNELGVFCAALLPIGVIAVVTATTRIGFAIQLASVLALAAAWVLSMSRGAWTGGCLALLIVAVFSPTTRKWLALATAGVAGFVVSALAAPPSAGVLGVVGARLKSFSEVSNNPYDDRPAIWAEGWRLAGEHPWLGVGPGGYQAAAGGSTSPVSFSAPLHPHNLVLTALSERGVFGLFGAAVVAVGCCVVLARSWEGRARGCGLDSSWRIAAVAGLVAVAGHGLFDMPLRNPIVSGLTWTLLGYAAVAETRRRHGEEPRSQRTDTANDLELIPGGTNPS